MSLEADRVHVVHNPGSTNPDNYKVFAHELFDNGIDYDILPTERHVAGMRANIEAVDPQPGDIFALMTGDGGANIFSRAALDLELANFVIFRKGGKANDGANSHNGDADFFEILRYGVPAKLHPLDMYVDAPGSPEEMYRAMAYIGVHGTGLAARALEPKRQEVRELRGRGKEFSAKKVEALTSLGAIADAAPIIAEFDGRSHSLADLTYVGISRMAREGKVHTNPFHPEQFRRLATGEGGMVRIAASMSMLGAGVMLGRRVSGETEAVVYSSDGNNIALHVDGEVEREGKQLEVPSASGLTVVRSDRYLNTLTVRRRWARKAAAA